MIASSDIDTATLSEVNASDMLQLITPTQTQTLLSSQDNIANAITQANTRKD